MYDLYTNIGMEEFGYRAGFGWVTGRFNFDTVRFACIL
jgi:hypothetical protein